jgi:hypothetical protein
VILLVRGQGPLPAYELVCISFPASGILKWVPHSCARKVSDLLLPTAIPVVSAYRRESSMPETKMRWTLMRLTIFATAHVCQKMSLTQDVAIIRYDGWLPQTRPK